MLRRLLLSIGKKVKRNAVGASVCREALSKKPRKNSLCKVSRNRLFRESHSDQFKEGYAAATAAAV